MSAKIAAEANTVIVMMGLHIPSSFLLEDTSALTPSEDTPPTVPRHD